MKILFVAMQYIHSARWINQLKDSGHEIYLFDCLDSPIHKDLQWTTYTTNWSKRKIKPLKGETFLKKHFPSLNEKIMPFLKVTASEKLQELIQEIQPDVVHSMERGAIIGLIAAAVVLAAAHFLGWANSAAGWIPFIFLAIVVLGFCTWEGGLIGIQRPNVNFERFQKLLKQGHHILFVDVDPEQELAIASVMKAHPKVSASGFGESTPSWVVRAQDRFKSFMKTMP